MAASSGELDTFEDDLPLQRSRRRRTGLKQQRLAIDSDDEEGPRILGALTADPAR